MSNMDLNAVRLFVATVQAGSLSKASNELNVPIATISRQIKLLEQSLNIQLFDRHKTGVKPTAQGQQFYEQVYLDIDNLLHTERNLQTDKQTLNGVLRISTIIGADHIWNLLTAFQNQFPDVQVYVQATERVVDLVADGIDIAFRTGDLQTDNVIAMPLMAMGGAWVASTNFVAKFGEPKTPQDLLTMPCASFGRLGQKSIGFTWQNKQGKNQSLDVPCVLLSNDNSAILHLAKTGRAVCFISAYTAKDLIEKGEVVPILADFPSVDIYTTYALYLSHRHQSAVVKAFIEFLKGTKYPTHHLLIKEL
ncbi:MULTISPECIES: LysR family transcriptional regulator [unclassified Moraxella]|uniref:LysR family transcriptional regulator n=1 Tax=unclassified Moraxella TaxID=2685852 RepID=UPI003AF4386A